MQGACSSSTAAAAARGSRSLQLGQPLQQRLLSSANLPGQLQLHSEVVCSAAGRPLLALAMHARMCQAQHRAVLRAGGDGQAGSAAQRGHGGGASQQGVAERHSQLGV